MKKLIILILIVSNTGCSSAQNLPKEEMQKITVKLKKWKDEDLKELEILVNEFILLDSVEQRNFARLNHFSKEEYYPYLKKYSKALAPHLFRHYKLNEYYREPLGLLDLPEYMKDSLLNFKYTESYIKAALGDVMSEQDIINTFKKVIKTEINTDSLSRIFMNVKKHLLYINSSSTIYAYLEAMSTDKVFVVDYNSTLEDELKLRYSLFESLRSTYSSVYKYIPIISNNYVIRFHGIEMKTKDMKIYFKEIENYFLKKYDIKITIKAPYIAVGHSDYIEDQIIEDPDKN